MSRYATSPRDSPPNAKLLTCPSAPAEVPTVSRPDLTDEVIFAGLEAHQNWTAARCQHLLRQLESRLMTLREIMRAPQPEQVPQRANPPADPKHKKSNRPRRTYGIKSRINTRANSVSGHIARDTTRGVRVPGTMMLAQACTPSDRYPPLPFRRTRNEEDIPTHTSPSTGHSEPERGVSRAGLGEFVRQLQPLRKTLSNDQWRAHKSVLSYLDNMLRITQGGEEKTHRKSLLAMCLRKLPACIEHIDTWDQQVSGETPPHVSSSWVKVSQEIYEQLEGLSLGGSHWELKKTIRAHIMWFLSKAISEGLFERTFVNVLVQLCLRYASISEALDLTAAASMQRRALNVSRSRKNSLPHRYRNDEVFVINLLENTGGHSRLSGLITHHFALLLGDNQVSARFVVNKMKAVVATGVDNVLCGCGNVSDLKLLSAVLHTLALESKGRSYTQDNREPNMLVSLTASLVNGVADMSETREKVSGKTTSQVWRAICTTLNDAIRQLQPRLLQSQSGNMIILMIAKYFAIAGCELASERMSHETGRDVEIVLDAADARVLTTYRQIVISLMCSMAREAALRGTTALGHECFVRACRLLNQLTLPRQFSCGLQKEGAFVLAMQSRDLRDLAFAERQVQNNQQDEYSPTFSSWRWEEGIGEWILPSPVQENRFTRASCGKTRIEPLNPGHASEDQSQICQDRNDDKVASWVSYVGRERTSYTAESHAKRKHPSSSSNQHGNGVVVSAKRHRGPKQDSGNTDSVGYPNPASHGVNAHPLVGRRSRLQGDFSRYQPLDIRGRLEHKSGVMGNRSLVIVRGCASSGRSDQPLLSHVPTTQSLGQGSKWVLTSKSNNVLDDGWDELSWGA